MHNSRLHSASGCEEADSNWPRDFDVRAQYAEQQELLLTEQAMKSKNAGGTERDE